MQKKNKKGFTIVELVVVIAVIGILSAILIPTFMGLSDNARKQAIQSDLSSIYTQYAVEAADGEMTLKKVTAVTPSTTTEDKVYSVSILNQGEVLIEYKNETYKFNDKNVREAATAEEKGAKKAIVLASANTPVALNQFGDLVTTITENMILEYPTFAGYAVYAK